MTNKENTRLAFVNTELLHEAEFLMNALRLTSNDPLLVIVRYLAMNDEACSELPPASFSPTTMLSKRIDRILKAYNPRTHAYVRPVLADYEMRHDVILDILDVLMLSIEEHEAGMPPCNPASPSLNKMASALMPRYTKSVEESLLNLLANNSGKSSVSLESVALLVFYAYKTRLLTTPHKIKPAPKRFWRDLTKLLRFNARLPFTIGQSFEGIQCFGSTGSGKTSAATSTFCSAMMQAGYGMLMLTAKSEDAAHYLHLASENGRLQDCVRFSENEHACNLIDYLFRESNNSASEIANALLEAASIAHRKHGDTPRDSIWTEAAKQHLTHAIRLCYSAYGRVQMDDLTKIIKSAPKTLSNCSDPTYVRESQCLQAVKDCAASTDKNTQLSCEYFSREYPTLPHDTQGSVDFSLNTQLLFFIQVDPIRRMFFGETTFTPKDILDGKIVIVDLPAVLNPQVGKMVCALMKWIVQDKILRRGKCSESDRPITIVCDESHLLISERDVNFQTVARSHRCCTLDLCQSISSYYKVLGKDGTDVLMGNKKTTLFFANSDTETCKWMSEMLSKEAVDNKTITTSGGKRSESRTPTESDVLPPRATHNLKCGGEKNRYLVEAILVQGARVICQGKKYLLVKFSQKAKSPFVQWVFGITHIAKHK